VADVIRKWMPTGLCNMSSSRSQQARTGRGRRKFAPVLAALKETGYDGWVAMEPFIYEPDGPTCAARMIATSRPSGAFDMKVKWRRPTASSATSCCACRSASA